MLQERKEYYNDLISKAQDALKLYETKASGLTAADVKNVLGDLHKRLLDVEITNDVIITAQCELERSYNKYAHFFDLSPVGLLTLDSEGLIMEANLAFANITGMERRKLIRRNLSSLIYAQDHKTFGAFFDALRRSIAGGNCEIRLLKDGLICRAYINGVNLSGAEGPNENYLLTVSVCRI